MKTYVLIVSTEFPKSHKKAGQKTGFLHKIACAVFCNGECNECLYEWPKKHTIRSNYELWEKRAKEINSGKTVLSVRYWNDKPYRSKQTEVCQIENIGVQRLDNPQNFVYAEIDGKKVNWEDIAKNDGLLFDDFCEWFKVRQTEPMVIIHFTPFRY